MSGHIFTNGKKVIVPYKEVLFIENSKSTNDKYFYTVVDVISILGVSKSTAYREIKGLNSELMGYITISGKVPAKYFMERLYC